MKARELMITDVITVSEYDLAKDAIELMAEHDVSGLPVLDSSGRLVGVISERDLLELEKKQPKVVKTALYGLWIAPDEFVRKKAQRRGVRVEDVMTRKVISFSPDDEVADIAHTMFQRGINRVPIVEDGKVVGIITRHDIIEALARDERIGQ